MSEGLKTLGLIGGMTWHSTAEYYRIINEVVGEKAGGLHSAPLLLYSVDFEPIDLLMRGDNWPRIGDIVVQLTRTLDQAGVDGLAITSNTIHKVADLVEAATDKPLLHIVDPTAHAIQDRKFGKVALLGTATTMTEDFYMGRLRDRHHINVIVPDEEEKQELNRIIFDELGVGRTSYTSRDWIVDLIGRMGDAEAEGVILGCTELGELVLPSDTDVPLFDTTALHARALADFILSR